MDCIHKAESCKDCNRKGHIARICPGGERCKNCDKLGHLAKVCYSNVAEAHKGKGKGQKGQKDSAKDGKDSRGKGAHAVELSSPHKDAHAVELSSHAAEEHIKKQNCRSWIKSGKCDYKEGMKKCKRKHAADLKGKGATTPCEMLAKGACRFGDDCIFNHKLTKKANIARGPSERMGGNGGAGVDDAACTARITEQVFAAIDKQIAAQGDPDQWESRGSGKTRE